MKRFIYLFLFLGMVSCKVQESPEFVKVENIKVLSSSPTNIVLSMDAMFNNPNHIGGTLQAKDIKIQVNDIYAATINSKAFDVPIQDHFTIPLKVSIPTKDIFKDKDIVSSVLNLVQKKALEINYQGDIVYSLAGFSKNYALNETETVKIN